MKKLAIGCDHSAVELKNIIIEHIKSQNIEIVDFGTTSTEASNYPDYAAKVAQSIQSGEFEHGILICGTGIGISIAANKHKGIRCAVCSEPYSAKLSKEHNNSNIIAFGARVVGSEMAKMIVDSWLNAEFMGGKHQSRIDMITDIENNNF